MRALILLLVVTLFSSSAMAATKYIVADGATVEVDEFSNCKNVTNNTGYSMMVPTNSAAEWHTGGASFLENLPTGVTVTACSSPCGGASVGGYCWYASSDLTKSCDTVCAGNGGCDLTGTKNYAGSGGTLANCQSVVTALGLNYVSGFSENFGFSLGCAWHHMVYVDEILLDTSATTCGSSGLGALKRICACNN